MLYGRISHLIAKLNMKCLYPRPVAFGILNVYCLLMAVGVVYQKQCHCVLCHGFKTAIQKDFCSDSLLDGSFDFSAQSALTSK